MILVVLVLLATIDPSVSGSSYEKEFITEGEDETVPVLAREASQSIAAQDKKSALCDITRQALHVNYLAGPSQT